MNLFPLSYVYPLSAAQGAGGEAEEIMANKQAKLRYERMDEAVHADQPAIALPVYALRL